MYNGVNYSDVKVQNFIKKNYGKIYISITLDGTKEKHDMQRVFPNGEGSYDIIRKNVDLWLKQFIGNTKVTFASDDLSLLRIVLYSCGMTGLKMSQQMLCLKMSGKREMIRYLRTS